MIVVSINYYKSVMSFICFLIILFFSISNKFIFCKFGSDNDSISSSLLESVEKARTNLKVIQELIYFSQEFQELYKLTRDEILRFGDIIKTIPNHDSYTHNRFTQVSEPANEGKIRESLYVTQLKRSSPQSTVSIDVKEVLINVGDIVKNSTELNSFTEDPYENYFEDELQRMESES
uniref:Uncharacterized protein n=1 Tax=Theileria annulata TaxID=5874 RepID=A0A3B0NCJ4_THEAN